jgi:hypothetical protein
MSLSSTAPQSGEDVMADREQTGKADVAALARFLAEFGANPPSQYAFIRRGKVMCFYADAGVALEAGSRSFPDQEFSVVDVRARKVILRN